MPLPALIQLLLPPSLLCRIGIYTFAESTLHTSSPLRYLDSLIYFRHKGSIKETPLWLNPFPVHTIVPVPKSQNTIGQFPQKSCRMPSPPTQVRSSQQRETHLFSLAGWLLPRGDPPPPPLSGKEEEVIVNSSTSLDGQREESACFLSPYYAL